MLQENIWNVFYRNINNMSIEKDWQSIEPKEITKQF
jgi:hypothetical protein